jgi:hypothetical protein
MINQDSKARIILLDQAQCRKMVDEIQGDAFA